MWCLKMRDKTLLAKKKENFIVEWAIVWQWTSSTAGQLQDEVQYNDFQLPELLAELLHMTLYAGT